MKKTLHCFLFVCIIPVLFSCAKKTDVLEYIEDASLSHILIKRELIIGVDASMPILSFRNKKNELTGFDIEIFKELCRRMNIRPVFYPINWAEKETLLNTGVIDCIISGFSKTEERNESYTLTAPYLQNAQVLVTLARSGYTQFSDLQNKKIYVQAASLSKQTIENNASFGDGVKIVECSDFTVLQEMLGIGRADAIAVDLISAYDKLMEKDIYTIMEEPLSVEFYTFAFRKNDKTLARKVENLLKEMDKDRTIPILSQKWFGANLSIINISF